MYEEFPHEITFQENKAVGDGGGGKGKPNWVDFFSTEAFVSPVTSREFYLAQQTKTPIDYNVFYPYQDGVRPSMRIKYGEKYLAIKSKPIDQGGQGEILMIKCEQL